MSTGGSAISRRRLLGAAGTIGLGGAVAAVAPRELLRASSASADDVASTQVAFHGVHQAGIVTPAQGRLVYVALDVTSTNAGDLRDLLRRWSDAIAAMTQGKPVGAVAPSDPSAAPTDTGEALELGPANLTVTVGFGRSLFVDQQGHDRLGLRHKLPDALVDLPSFRGDVLDPDRCGGDLSLQCCADDAQVAFHAFHDLVRLGRGTVTVRWVQLGFGRTSTTSDDQSTPRNLMGFKDGTNNVKAQDTKLLRDHVWVGGGDDPSWMRGGSYAVVRRIRMHLESWDRSALQDQEQTIGRRKVSGAPIGSRREHDTPHLASLPADSHIRLAAPAENAGMHLLRRGYSFADGIDDRTGELDAGLFFVAYQRDPRHQFVPIQQRLATSDALNEYISHVGSAVFAVPPGTRHGYVGETLFD